MQIKRALKAFGTLVLAAATSSIMVLAQAPGPSYTAGGQLKQVTNVSPAITQFGSTFYLVYSNSNDGGIIYSSTNTSGGLNFNSPGVKTGSYSPTSGVSVVGFNGTLYVAFASGNAIYLLRSTDGVNWKQSIAVGSAYNPSSTARPAIAYYNNTLLLAFTSGSTVRTAVYTPGGSQDFSVNANSPGIGAQSGPNMYWYNGLLYLTYTNADGSGHPVVCTTQDGNGNFSSGSPCAVDNSIQFGNDPTFVGWNNQLVLQGKSHYSEDELWGTTANNLTFSTQYEYGQTLTQSPALATFNGHLYECARSKNGSNIWCYYN